MGVDPFGQVREGPVLLVRDTSEPQKGGCSARVDRPEDVKTLRLVLLQGCQGVFHGCGIKNCATNK